MKIKLLFLPILLSANTYSQTCKDASVELSAVVQASPPKITLNWVANATSTQHIVYRKLKTDISWGAVVATLTGAATQYVDATVALGISYEYKVERTGTNYVGYGYINSGIEIPVTEQRGKLILIVDSTFVDSIPAELTRLEKDLEGDGWKVIRHNVKRTASVTSVKALIVADYNLDPANTKAIFLVGHVPVPYSGNINPDGHPDHMGAWPADVFYAEINGTWTDASVNNTTATDPRIDNIPGDGKYDQDSIPNDVELQIGRVDFANMPAFASSEKQLLKNYLDKDHNYRHKIFTAQHRAVIDDNFGYFGGEAFAASGWKNFGPLVGPGNVSANDYFTTQTGNSYLWSYGCGPGTYTDASGVGSTANFASSNLQSVFTLLFGSYFGDWDSQNNFLRAPLAQGTTLTNAWSGRPHWLFHHMALGENIGYGTRISQNNSPSFYFSDILDTRYVHIALMGDPTLRNDIVAPVSNVVATKSGTNCNIAWTASADAVLGYNIYMKNETMTDYVRINPTLITGTSYSDACLLYTGIYTYMVRALLLQTSPSGTYYNLSQGISDTAMNNTSVLPIATAGTDITICAGSNNTIGATATTSTTYSWASSPVGFSSTLAMPTINPTVTTTYTVTATNSCGAASDVILVTVKPLPNASATYSMANNVVTFTNTSTNASGYQWDFGDATTSTLDNPIHPYAVGNYTVTLIASSGNGCGSSTFLIFISIVTGIEETMEVSFVSVFPNPSHDVMEVSLSQVVQGELRITDFIGREVYKGTINATHVKVNVSNLPIGYYNLSITSGAKTIHKKIMIAR